MRMRRPACQVMRPARNRVGTTKRLAAYGIAVVTLVSGTTFVGALPAGAEVPTGTRTFTVTGTTQVFVVPPGVTRLTVDARGAQGSKAHPQEADAFGGKGGRVRGNLTVTPGEVLFVEVGGAGKDWTALPNNGGYNGGGNGVDGTSVYWGSGGGGGASDVRRGGDLPSHRLFSAGGGGGGGVDVPGGASGSAGTSGSGSYPGGGGGGASAGTPGAGGTAGGGAQPGQAGTTAGAGGAGGQSVAYSSDGGGGGGGWRGGGGGGGANGPDVATWSSGGGGGGGSSYAGALSGTTITQGVQTGDGMVQFSWAAPLTKPSLPTATSLVLSPATQQRLPDFPAHVVARVLDQYGDPLGGVPVVFTRSGADTDAAGTTAIAASDGTASYSFTSSVSSTGVVLATVAGSPTARAAAVAVFGNGTSKGAGTEVALLPPVATTAPGETVDLPFVATNQAGGPFSGTVRYGTGAGCGSPAFTSATSADASGTGTITVTAGDDPICVWAYADRTAAGATGSRDDTEVLGAGAVVPVGPPPSPGTELVFTTPVTSAPVGVTTFAAFKALRYDGSPFVGTVRWGYGPAGSTPEMSYEMHVTLQDNGSGSVPVAAAASPTEIVAYADRPTNGRPGTRDETEVPGSAVVLGVG